MASFLSSTFFISNLHLHHQNKNLTVSPSKVFLLQCYQKKEETNNNSNSKPENALLKVAWYGSEFLGIAASLLRSPSKTEDTRPESQVSVDGFGKIDRAFVVESIKQDFQRSYFVTGKEIWHLMFMKMNVNLPTQQVLSEAYKRFKRNCTNFGYLLEKSDMKLMKWEDFEDRGIGHWRFSCVMTFPWKPILSATGYTEYYFNDKSGKVCRHVEHWNVPKMALFKQILRPSRRSKNK